MSILSNLILSPLNGGSKYSNETPVSIQLFASAPLRLMCELQNKGVMLLKQINIHI